MLKNNYNNIDENNNNTATTTTMILNHKLINKIIKEIEIKEVVKKNNDR